jgi:hypothetical protein
MQDKDADAPSTPDATIRPVLMKVLRESTDFSSELEGTSLEIVCRLSFTVFLFISV